MKEIKKIIIGFIIIIIFIIILLIVLLNKQNDIDNVINNNFDEYGGEFVPEKNDNGYADVTDANIFYSVVNSVNKYIEIVQYNINSKNDNIEEDVYVDYDLDYEYLLNIEDEQDRIQALYNLLDTQYIENNTITVNNIMNYIYYTNENTILIPMQMKVKYGTNIDTYILKAYLNYGDRLEEKLYILRVNNENQSFSIEFLKDDVNNIEDIKIEENENQIIKNDYNEYKIEILGNDKIAQKYLEHYRYLSINYPEVVYNYYLNKEYKEKRFGSLDGYKKYIENNKEELEHIQITKYLIENTEDNNTEYVCLDQYENTYVFSEKSVMQYNVTLDTYTIESDKFRTTYEESDDQYRVKMNINKFVMMLNNRDYSAAYSLLDETFRNNNFGNIENFEEYMKNNYPLHYKVEYSLYEQKGKDIYSQEIRLLDITNKESNVLELLIIMKLKDNTDFVMSFAM